MEKPYSLGQVKLDESTIEHDFTMLDKFQGFSAELLRISLLGIGAIGLGASEILFPSAPNDSYSLHFSVKLMLLISLISFCVSAASALLHRYTSADGMSWHIQAMRRYASNVPEEIDKAKKEALERHKQYKLSQRAIRTSSFSLLLGTIFLAISIWCTLP